MKNVGPNRGPGSPVALLLFQVGLLAAKDAHSLNRFLSKPWLEAVAALGLALGLLGALSYFQVFSTFAPYDDEGYLMLVLRHFLKGHALYDQVWTLYGPIYFGYKWLLHGLLGLPLTDDVVRLTTLGMRLASGLLGGVAVLGLTRRPLAGVISFVLVTRHLAGLNSEPGHPQELGTLLMLLLAAIACAHAASLSTRLPFALGVVVALCALTKVNLGLLAGVATGMALVSFLPPTRLGSVLRAGAAILALLLPSLLMLPLLSDPVMQRFAVTETASVLALSVLALGRPSGGDSFRWLALLVAATLAVVLFSIALLCMGDTSLSAVLDALVLSPARMPAMFVSQIPHPYFPLPVLGAVLAIAARRMATSSRGFLLVSWARVAFGLVVLASSSLYAFPTIASLTTPFVWLVLPVLPEEEPAPPKRLARCVIGWMAVVGPLQAFPVAGTQVGLGTVVHVVAAVLCLGYGASALASRSARLGGEAFRAAGLRFALLLVLGGTTFHVLWCHRIYSRLQPMELPGTTRLRATQEQVGILQRLTTTLRVESDAFLSIPGFNSLYFWAGKEPPTLDVIGHQMRFYSDERQARMVEALLQHPRPMVVHFSGLAEPYPPLEALLARKFKPFTSIGKYELLVPR